MIGTLAGVSLAAYVISRRVVRIELSSDDRSLALTVLQVLATITSLLLAFSAISVWESFGAAEDSVVREADTIGELARDLAVFGTPEARAAREELRHYAQLVIDTEWGEMRFGRASTDAWVSSDNIVRGIGRLDADTPQHQALLPEIWARTNELIGHRRDRLYRSQAEVPATLWIVVLAGAILTLATLFVFPPTRLNLAMLTLLAMSLGLVFFFIIAMDRPFAGRESISPAPFQSALDNMRRWDSQ